MPNEGFSWYPSGHMNKIKGRLILLAGVAYAAACTSEDSPARRDAAVEMADSAVPSVRRDLAPPVIRLDGSALGPLIDSIDARSDLGSAIDVAPTGTDLRATAGPDAGTRDVPQGNDRPPVLVQDARAVDTQIFSPIVVDASADMPPDAPATPDATQMPPDAADMADANETPDATPDAEPLSPDAALACGRIFCDCTALTDVGVRKRLWGKVKTISVGIPDFKIRVVNLGPVDLKVKSTTFPSKCGEWKDEPTFIPDFTVMIVNIGEDFSITYDNFNPGLGKGPS